MRRLTRVGMALLLASFATLPVFAQGTTGAIEGRIADEQGLPLPGATVSVQNAATGFTRSAVSDSTGLVRLPGLPVGNYEMTAELTGFAPQHRKVVVNVGATTTFDVRLTVAGQTEELTVTAETPLIDSTQTGIGEIVTGAQIENLPLNGRQFGNLAALVPGVSLGFHTDPTKSTQFAPQVNGGGGRNINYLIDGGDNNDDTVGGLVQLFPLDSIGEFNFETQRFRADTGRSNGGTVKVVTKSGTNDFRGSAFEFFRDKSLNARTETEKLSDAPKGDYRRHQFGASLGGPIVKDKTHFFFAFERTAQDTTQAVNTLGLFPEKDGVFGTPYRENLAVGKLTHQVDARNYLSVRYGYNDNSQAYGASPQTAPEGWGTSKNKFHSVNANLNTAIGGGRLNEFVFQFSYFRNHIGENSTLPYESFPNGVFVGQNINTPQSTEQHKYQFRDDFTWTKGSHELKAGVSFIYEPVLDLTFSTGQQPQYTHLDDDRNSPISSISYNGSITAGGGSLAQIPNNQYAIYLQDGWRVNNKLLLDLGLRYDLVTGMAFDQTNNIIFSELQAAAAAGVFQRSGLPCPCPGFEDFGKSSAEDKNNIAARVGFSYDVKADGRSVLRGGYGRYYDFAYTNANILFAVVGAQSSFGTIYEVDNTDGIRNADGSFFQVGQPLPPNQLEGAEAPLPSHAASPRIKQPYQDQFNLGFSHDLGHGYAVSVEGVYSQGHDLGTRSNLNLRINGGARRLASFLPQSGTTSFRVDTSDGFAHYKGVNLTVKKRWDGNLQLLGWYSLSKSTSSASLRATDEFGEYNVLDMFDPFQERQEAPTRTDARHRFTVSGTWQPGAGFSISPIFRYKSKTPYNVILGIDTNRDGTTTNDLPSGVDRFNSARGADFKQFDLRASKRFGLGSRAHVELIAEVFNLLNSKNPGGFVSNMQASNFGQPTEFAGDFQRGEQRVGQFGLRFEF
jgi:Carboxypeptidase regulatory-like domain/TonB dependent receptor-like, beta-barrel